LNEKDIQCRASIYINVFMTMYIVWEQKYSIQTLFKNIFETKKKDYAFVVYILVRTSKQPSFNCNTIVHMPMVSLNLYMNKSMISIGPIKIVYKCGLKDIS